MSLRSSAIVRSRRLWFSVHRTIVLPLFSISWGNIVCGKNQANDRCADTTIKIRMINERNVRVVELSLRQPARDFPVSPPVTQRTSAIVGCRNESTGEKVTLVPSRFFRLGFTSPFVTSRTIFLFYRMSCSRKLRLFEFSNVAFESCAIYCWI